MTKETKPVEKKADEKAVEKVEKVEKVVEPAADDEDEAGAMSKRRARKAKYVAKLEQYLHTYKNILVVGCDFVGSHQMQQVRMSLRPLEAVILMGKNTIIRKVLRDEMKHNPKLEHLLPLVRLNIGLVFTNGDLNQVREVILENKVPAAAKVGVNAPTDVFVPPGATGLDPGQTSFFQALNIGTKITRGAIEIVNEVHLVKAGERVTSSHVALLSKLNLKPFHYAFKVLTVYEDGSVYSASVLDLSEDDLLSNFFQAVRTVASVSLAINHPTEASLPHIIIGAFKSLVALSIETEYTFEESKLYKDMIANPDAYAAAPAEEAAAEEEAVEEEAEAVESEGPGGLGMFGDDE